MSGRSCVISPVNCSCACAALLKATASARMTTCSHRPNRCLVYIDLNMVRAGAVRHPAEWEESGYREIQAPPERYALIGLSALSALCGFANVARFQESHRQWVAAALTSKPQGRDENWSEAIAVGRRGFVEKVQLDLGIKVRHRDVAGVGRAHVLREPLQPYRALWYRKCVSKPEKHCVLGGKA
jgi:putative transposase